MNENKNRFYKRFFESYNFNYELNLLLKIILLMVLFTISRLGFYYFNMEHYADMTFPRFMRIMSGGLKFDISGILFVNSLYILLFLIPAPFRYKSLYQNFLKYLFFITNGIALAANTMDFFYFDFILKRSTADVFMFAKERNIFNLFSQFLIDYWQGPLFWIIQMAILVYFYIKIPLKKTKIEQKPKFYLTSLAWLLISVYFTIIGIRGGFTGTTRPITLGNAGEYTQKPLEMAIVLNTPFTIIRTLDKRPLKEEHYFTDKELEAIYNPVHHPKPKGAFKAMNVMVIVWESFAKEYTGALNPNLDSGKYLGYTPFSDSLMRNAKTFALAFANGRKSIDALPSLTASIPSMVNPYVTSSYATNKINSLASLLKEKGYTSAFFHGAPNGSMGFDAFMKVAGYDRYYGMTEYNNDDDFDGTWGIWDEKFEQYMAHEMNKLPQPFVVTFFSLSSHHPFNIPERYKGKFRKGPLKFDIPMQYSDNALRKFFNTVSKMPWYKNTLFVISADHSNKAYHDIYKTSIGNFSIPIIFYQPADSTLKGFDSTVVQQMDVLPTVLSYLNYDKDYLAFGQNALDTTITHFAVNYNNDTYQIIKGKYVLQFREEKTIALYNYIDDKLLRHNLIGKLHKVQQDMEKLLKAFIQQYNNRMIHNKLVAK